MAGRARDVTSFWRGESELDPDSNVQYGEGGAGTFSDGKLYTGIKDREHRIRWLLGELVAQGAPEDILVKASPHIGTDRLIKVVRNIREEIISLGGEVRFEMPKSPDILVENGQGAVTDHPHGGEEFSADRDPRDRPQRARHLRDAPRQASPWRRSRSRSASASSTPRR